MAESTTPLGGDTGWEEITIHCGGGLADAGSSEPDDVLPPLQLKGDFSFPADQSTSCPREGKALIAFHTSVKNNVHYSLDCTNGHFSGVAQPVPKPGGGYVAPAVATFDITKTTHAGHLRAEVRLSGRAQGPRVEGPQISVHWHDGRVRQ